MSEKLVSTLGEKLPRIYNAAIAIFSSHATQAKSKMIKVFFKFFYDKKTLLVFIKPGTAAI